MCTNPDSTTNNEQVSKPQQEQGQSRQHQHDARVGLPAEETVLCMGGLQQRHPTGFGCVGADRTVMVVRVLLLRLLLREDLGRMHR